jgi:hypothetical protein
MLMIAVLFAPSLHTVPKQNNAVDCGVYICKYALALHQLRFLPITYQHLYLTDPPLSVLTNSSSFDFTHHTITQLHQNMAKLVQNLSTLYLSNTVQIGSTQPAASVQLDTPNHGVQLQPLCTNDKIGIAKKLVGMFS